MVEKRKSKGSQGRSPDDKKGQQPEPNGVLEWMKSILIATVLFFVLRTFLVQTFVITSGSMEETLMVGDFLLVNRAAIGSRIPFTDVRIPGYSTPKRFDVLVFDPPHEENLKLVKRLIGLPGDTLSMEEGVLSINGEPLDEPYVQHVSSPDDNNPMMRWQQGYLHPAVDPVGYRPTRDTWGPLVLPEDRYFMLGDNRDTSLDSRYWGLLEGWRFEGRAFRIYFSYNKGSYRPFSWIREIRGSRIGDAIR